MTIRIFQLIVFLIFVLCAVLSSVFVSRVAASVERAKGDPKLVESLNALAFSGDGGPNIWSGHAFIMRRQYLAYGDPQLTSAGNRALTLLYIGYADAAAMVFTMLLDSIR